jgi:hypothetical protein
VLDRYTRLPASVHAFRNRHWRPMHHMLTTTLTDLDRQHFRNSAGQPRPRHPGPSSSFRSKARAVVLVASLLADMECWSDHMPWHEAYLKVMTELYPLLQKHPDVLEEVVHLG